MKSSTIVLIMFLTISCLYAEDATHSYTLELSNSKVNYIDIPTLNLQLKAKEKSSFEFIIEYASSLFSNTKEQDVDQKQHILRLAFNYEF